MANLWTMIEKRHPAPGWQVMFEVSNGTGYRADTRYADALAIGIWPSHGYAIHGYEIKQSREDLKKELSDPRKADAIGKYVDHWWLVLADIKLCEGIEIPPTWGILAPKGQILKVHRKAPKRKATPINRAFAAAMIRRVTEHWVPKHVHEEYKKNAAELARKEIERERKDRRDDLEYRLEQTLHAVQQFEKASGLKITAERYDGVTSMSNSWELDRLGDVVAIVRRAREHKRYFGDVPQNEAASIIRGELRDTERQIEQHERAVANRREVADRLRREIARLEAECQSGLVVNPDGAASPAPPDGDDHAGGGIDRGHPGTPEQDAGVELRDQRPEVSHGQEAPADPR